MKSISKRIREKWFWICGAALLGCVPLAPAATSDQLLVAQRQWPSSTLQDLERGRVNYLERCAGCHAPYPPRRFSPDLWPKLVADMRRNANLYDPAEEEDIVRYLVTASHAQRIARAQGDSK